MPPIAVKRASHSELRDKLRADILKGAFRPGERLKIDRLAERYGTSGMPVRQALLELQSEGLLVLAPHRGATVRLVDEELATNLYDLRKAVLGLLIARCIERISNLDVDELDRLEGEIQAGVDVDTIMAATDRFFRKIFEVAQNPEAADVLIRMWPLLHAVRRQYGLRERQAVYRNHHLLLSALRRRDAEAAVRIAQASCEASKADLIARIQARQRELAARRPNDRPARQLEIRPPLPAAP